MRNGPGCAALGLLMLVACASGGDRVRSPASPSSNLAAASLPGLPAALLPGYVVHVSSLDLTTLSADALDPAMLQALLVGAGFEAGRERRFTARGRRLTEVVARLLGFRSAQGAGEYVSWLGAHGVDLLGSRTQPADPPPLPGAIAFAHGVGGCCTKDTFEYFIAWSRGSYVMTLRVGGPGADRRSATPLARAIDHHVWKEA